MMVKEFIEKLKELPQDSEINFDETAVDQEGKIIVIPIFFKDLFSKQEEMSDQEYQDLMRENKEML